VRAVELRGQPHYQWTSHSDRREIHENLTPDDTLNRARLLIGAQYRNAHLFTADADYALRISKSGEPSLQRSRPTHRVAVVTHDRRKDYLIPEGRPCAFLEAIGVMTAEGRVRSRAQAKFRQINRYLEFVHDIYADLPPTGTLRVVDFGCGKSYLTFALHYLLTNIHGRAVQIVGLDRERSVIDECRTIAATLELSGIDFRVGDIVSHEAAEPVHLAVSLHACDTATDQALAKAVAWEADVIMAVPCCQHEIAGLMHGPPLIEDFGLLKERFAAMVTDALRAAALDAAGYRTQVVEFIDLEHTPKNVLIRAVRRQPGERPSERLQRDAVELRRLLGIEQFSLDRLLGADAACKT
jgi:SAM-dependent methyltransferase